MCDNAGSDAFNVVTSSNSCNLLQSPSRQYVIALVKNSSHEVNNMIKFLVDYGLTPSFSSIYSHVRYPTQVQSLITSWYHNSQGRQHCVPLDKRRLLLRDILHSLHKLRPGLLIKLLLWLSQHCCEDRHQLRGQLLDDRVASLVQANNAAVDRGVLLVVLLQWQQTSKNWQHIADRHLVWVGSDHAADAAGRVVKGASALSLEEWLELVQDLRVGGAVGVGVLGVLDEQTSGVSSVGARLGVLVCEAVEKKLKEGGGGGGDSSAHVGGALGDDANGGGALEGLLGGGKLHDWLLEDLPELTELGAEGGGEADHDIESGVNREPVVLGSLANVLLVLVITHIHLARVLASDKRGKDGGHLLEHVALSEDSWAAKLEGGGNVAVDVGNDGTVLVSIILLKLYKTI